MRKQRLIDCHNCPLSTKPYRGIDCAQPVAAHISQPGVNLNCSWLEHSYLLCSIFHAILPGPPVHKKEPLLKCYLRFGKKLPFRMLTAVLQSGHRQRQPSLMSDLSCSVIIVPHLHCCCWASTFFLCKKATMPGVPPKAIGRDMASRYVHKEYPTLSAVLEKVKEECGFPEGDIACGEC